MFTYKHTHATGYAYHALSKPTLGAALKAGLKQLQGLAHSLSNRLEMAVIAALLSACRKR